MTVMVVPKKGPNQTGAGRPFSQRHAIRVVVVVVTEVLDVVVEVEPENPGVPEPVSSPGGGGGLTPLCHIVQCSR